MNWMPVGSPVLCKSIGDAYGGESAAVADGTHDVFRRPWGDLTEFFADGGGGFLAAWGSDCVVRLHGFGGDFDHLAS